MSDLTFQVFINFLGHYVLMECGALTCLGGNFAVLNAALRIFKFNG